MVDRKKYIIGIEKYKGLPLNQLLELAQKGDIILATQFGLQLLKERIENNREQLGRETRIMQEAATEDNDLPENTAFQRSANRVQYELPREYSDLELNYNKTIVVEEIPNSRGSIGFGVGFTMQINYPGESDSETENCKLLGPLEAFAKIGPDGRRIVSYASPLGSTVIGKTTGQDFEYTSQAGHIRGKIIDVQ